MIIVMTEWWIHLYHFDWNEIRVLEIERKSRYNGGRVREYPNTKDSMSEKLL